MTRKFTRKYHTKRRFTYTGGSNIVLPFSNYISIHNDTIRGSLFETIVYGIQLIDNHKDLFTICGLDKNDQVWFGFQYMDASFYKTYLQKFGFVHSDTSVLRNHMLDGFSHSDTLVQDITNTNITIAISHLSLQIRSEFQIPWNVVYDGKELYLMMILQLQKNPSDEKYKTNHIEKPISLKTKPNNSSIQTVLFPTRQQMMKKMRHTRKKRKIVQHNETPSLSDSSFSSEQDDSTSGLDTTSELDTTSKLENVHGIGEKTVEMLHQKNIYTVKQLRDAIATQPTLLNNAQKTGLKYYEHLQKPILREEIQEYEIHLRNITASLDSEMNMMIAGSYRRNRPTSHDIDVLFTHSRNVGLDDDDSWLDTFVSALIDHNIDVVYLTRTSRKRMAIIRMPTMKFYRRIDFMITSSSTYPFALLYLTGPKEFTIRMRNIAIQKGYSLSENGFRVLETNKRVNVNDFQSEKDIFDFLEMDYLTPENRV